MKEPQSLPCHKNKGVQPNSVGLIKVLRLTKLICEGKA